MSASLASIWDLVSPTKVESVSEEKRLALTLVEETNLLAKHEVCYIYLEPLAGYDEAEIEFDHIYNYADGYPHREKIPCIIFVHPDVDELRVVIYEAHTDFVQQRYKKILYPLEVTFRRFKIYIVLGHWLSAKSVLLLRGSGPMKKIHG